MIETLVNTRTGAPTAPDPSLRLRDNARSHAVDLREAAAPLKSVDAPPVTTSTVSPDVLVAAQQARDVERVRTFDAREARDAYSATPERKQQGTENRHAFGAETDGGAHAEIIPLSGNSSFSSLSSGTGSTQSGPVASSDIAILTPARAEALADQAAQISGVNRLANQAYVRAGAQDGHAFDATGLNPAPRPIDLLA